MIASARVREIVVRLASVLSRRRGGTEIDDELETHLAFATDEYVRRGLPSDEARRLALIEAGGVTGAVEAYRDQRGLPFLDRLWQDVRFGARMLRRSPGFAVVAVAAIGLAIGVNSAMFTLVDAMMWQPIPVVNPQRMVKLIGINARGQQNIRFSYSHYKNIATHSTTIEDVVGYDGEQIALRVASSDARAIPSSVGGVTGNYFAALGGRASAGRLIVPADDREGADAVAVLSDGFWRRMLGGDPDAVGRNLIINGHPVRIVGVARPEFIGINPLVPDVWMSLTAAAEVGATPGRLLEPTNRFIVLRARLKPGLTMSQASAELSGVVAEPSTAAPGSDAALNRLTGVTLLPNDVLIPLSAETALVALPGLVLVALILVIACANLTNLLLARALVRQREIAVRLALGASRARIVRQLLTESLLVALLGSVLGLLLANWTVAAASRRFFEALPVVLGTVMLALRPSWHVFAYTVLLAVISVLTFGLAPALQSTSPDLAPALKGEDAAFGTRIRRSRFRNALVAAQVAACVVLLVAVGILVQSLRARAALQTGLRTRGVVMAQLGFASSDHVPQELTSARRALAARAATIPGVVATARVASWPFGNGWSVLRAAPTGDHALVGSLFYNVVTTRYFDVVGQRLIAGRTFTAADSSADAPVVIVTLSAARSLWGEADPVGRTVRVLAKADSADRQYTVVGVVADAHTTMIYDDGGDGYMFLLATATDLARGDMSLMLRHQLDVADVPRQLDDIARQIAPNAPLQVGALESAFQVQLLPVRYAAFISSGIGFLGLGLAVVGLYGVVAFAVAQRRREVAVHMAMGAAARDVLRLVMGREMRLVLMGVTIGIAIALLEAKVLGSTIVPLAPLPFVGFASVIAVLLVVSALAIMAPALGALRIAPMEELRHE